jgi:uncharacterized protein YaiI (UPF0178 family)
MCSGVVLSSDVSMLYLAALMGWMDALIVATVRQTDLVILTYDAHLADCLMMKRG